MGEKDEKPIRVVDRRMFTPDGELRPDFEPEEPAAPAPPPPPSPSRPASAAAPPPAAPTAPMASTASTAHDPSAPSAPEASPAGSRPEPPAADGEAGGEGEPPPAQEPRGEFTAIVRSLATTAYSALGLLPDPSGARHRPEPAVARQMIDWLSVLESKTRNNLSFEESDFLSRVLYELRMAFVEVVGPVGGGARPTRPPGR